MNTEQIIYTSCKQGITGHSSGYQVYSYSSNMEQWIAQRNAIGVLEQYRAPMGPQYPALPTAEQVEQLFPRRSYCGPLVGPDELYGMTLCTYIGRDYPEGSIRGGNFLAHAAVVPVSQMDGYPCEYIESPSFMRAIALEKVRSDDRPALLSTLHLERNEAISFDAVQSFLQREEHGSLFTLMLSCFLHREVNGSVRRIIIRDDAENFALWVAALQMALPVRQALTYSFSTYENNLASTDAHIVRAADGMTGTLASFTTTAYVFDERNEIPLPQPADDSVTSQVCEFIAEAIQYAPESLKAFHLFLDATDYDGTDTQIGDAYNLFQLTAGLTNFEELDLADINRAIAFLQNHCTKDVWHDIADKVFEECRGTLFDDERRRLLRDALVNIVRNGTEYATIARESSLNLLFDLFTSATPDKRMYEQSHDIAAAIFAASGQNVDVILFDQLTDNPGVNLGLEGVAGASLPWTVNAYAEWTAQALLKAASAVSRFPIGGSIESMQAALGASNAKALNKLVAVIVHHPDDAGTGRLAADFATSLGANNALSCLIDVMIIRAGDPPAADTVTHSAGLQANVERAYNAFRQLYESQDDGSKIAFLQTCSSSGLGMLTIGLLSEQAAQNRNDPNRFFAFLRQAIPMLSQTFVSANATAIAQACEAALPEQAGAEIVYECTVTIHELNVIMPRAWYQQKVEQISDAIAIVDPDEQDETALRNAEGLCTDLALAKPQRLLLVEFQFWLKRLDNECGAKRPDMKHIDRIVTYVIQTGPTLPISEAGSQSQAFIRAVANRIAYPTIVTKAGQDLQVRAVPQEHCWNLVKLVLRRIIASKDVEAVLMLLAVDSLYFGINAKAMETNQFVNQFCGYVSKELASMKIKASSFEKLALDDKHLTKVADAYRKTYGRKFPNDSFTVLVDLIDRALVDNEKKNPSGFGKLRNLFGGSSH